MKGVVGVCSWSLQPGSPGDLIDKVIETGCRAVQLALDPIRTGAWDERETFERLAEAGIAVRSGMAAMEGEDYSSIEAIARTGGVRPDETWPINLEACEALAEIAGRHGIALVTFHAGFLPHDPDDAERKRMVERLREMASIYSNAGVRVGLETGQEDAADPARRLRRARRARRRRELRPREHAALRVRRPHRRARPPRVTRRPAPHQGRHAKPLGPASGARRSPSATVGSTGTPSSPSPATGSPGPT